MGSRNSSWNSTNTKSQVDELRRRLESLDVGAVRLDELQRVPYVGIPKRD